MVLFRLYYLGLGPYENARHFLGLSEHSWVQWTEPIRQPGISRIVLLHKKSGFLVSLRQCISLVAPLWKYSSSPQVSSLLRKRRSALQVEAVADAENFAVFGAGDASVRG